MGAHLKLRIDGVRGQSSDNGGAGEAKRKGEGVA